MKKLRKISVKTKHGAFVLEFSEKGLYAVRFPGKHPLHTPGMSGVTQRVCERGGKRLDLSGYTSFQKNVYRTLMKVPAGTSVTYSALAKRAGYPGAARAVGCAMKRNRLPLVIPCHRVVPSMGGIGEYSAGKKWKCFLLRLEKQALSPRQCLALEPGTGRGGGL